jgi:hypothetical protein
MILCGERCGYVIFTVRPMTTKLFRRRFSGICLQPSPRDASSIGRLSHIFDTDVSIDEPRSDRRSYTASPAAAGFQFQGSRSPFGRMLGDARESVGEPGLRIDVIHLSGDLVVTIRLYIAAARLPPLSEPQNDHDITECCYADVQ